MTDLKFELPLDFKREPAFGIGRNLENTSVLEVKDDTCLREWQICLAGHQTGQSGRRRLREGQRRQQEE